MYKNERRGPLHEFNFIVDKFFKNEIYFMNN